VYLKQMNQKGQALLEKVAEPLASIAGLAGKEYPHHLFTYAWKTLMQNHPHDSICGCSVDEVHREMVTRFDKSRHVAESIIEDSARFIAGAVDTSVFAGAAEAVPFVVMNTTGWSRTGTVSIELDAARLYLREGYGLEETSRRMQEFDLSGRVLLDDSGKALACTVEDLGLEFGYDLPDDKFRQPFMCRRVKLTFEAAEVPALGLRAYAWTTQQAAAAPAEPSLLSGGHVLENAAVRVEVAADGSFSLHHKQSGAVYRDLGIYENTGDIGNEYMYRQPDGELPLTTKGLDAAVAVLEDTPFRAAIEITHAWEIPASADAGLNEEQRALVYYPERKAQRSTGTVILQLRTVISLEREGKGLHIESTINNTAKDHRVRMLFPTDLQTAVHHADSMFEIATRDNEPAAEWQNPSNTQHQQSFVDVSTAEAGMTVANLGLNEYEVLRDGRNTIAVTLLRSVGELGDWGWFPTPEAQCLGEHTVQLMLIPHTGDGIASGAYAQAYQFQAPWTIFQTDIHSGTIASGYSPLSWKGAEAAFSSMKMNATTGDLLLRWYNMSGSQAQLDVQLGLPHEHLYRTGILEESTAPLPDSGDARHLLELGPCEIATFGIHLGA
ncbi:glycoside hydrolase family 38 C-terminal domain-containing protein, partial [Paenibacillus sonchi]